MADRNNKLGRAFGAYLETVQHFYDPESLALLKAVSATSPSPQTVEIAWQLLNSWTGTGFEIPTPIPPAPGFVFPQDHGEHWNTPIEWRYITLSLTLTGGGRVSVVANFFRKAIAPQACAPGLSDVERQVYSTSLGVTLELPGCEAVHYALPNQTFSALEGGVEVNNTPFRMLVGKNALVGTEQVFPLQVHLEDPGDPLSGRPALKIEVTCAASNPPFPQGQNGYVGPPVPAGQVPSVGWYYYSWPQQACTGQVLIAGNAREVITGLAWVDHQWGGYAPPASPTPPQGNGWCWFEFQFEGNYSLTFSCPHGPLADGKLPLINPGFGTFVDQEKHQLVSCALEVSKYTKSPYTAAWYPCEWTLETGSKEEPFFLIIKPVASVPNQVLWMGTLLEYAEASCEVTAIGVVNGLPVELKGVGFCEGVSFEDIAATTTRAKTWLKAILSKSQD